MNDKKLEKLGVYVCHCGGNISDYVNTSKVAEVIQQEPEVHMAKDFIFMCSDAGQKMIAEDIKANDLTHVIVASCSPRLHHMTFQKVVSEAGINPFTYRHVNIREQVSWVTSHDEPAATEKAIRLIRGAISAVVRLQELATIEKQMIQVGAVIGGGVSGMTAALDIANQGLPVHLIESSPVLGGRTLDLDKLYPYEIPADKFVQNLIKKINSNENIYIHLNTEVVDTAGTIGDFTLKLKRTDNKLVNTEEMQSFEIIENESDAINVDELHVGTITIATGFDTYVPLDGEYGYGKSKQVITLPDLIMHLNSYKKKRLEINGKIINKVAMIHCVGSRQIEDVHPLREGATLNNGCSRTCCTATLQQANRLKDMFPDIDIYDLYRDIRTYGEKEVYYKKASENNVIFIKYPDEEIPQVDTNGSLKIRTVDELTYGLEVEVEVDLIVLAVAMIPRAKPRLIETLSLATGVNGFLQEAHVKLQPVESPVDGIFYAGTAQGPKDVRESTMSASATSVKASTLLKKEIVELSPYIAEVNTEICDGNGDCITQCEYNAISIVPIDDGKKQAIITPALCVSCGACVPACKKNAIKLNGYEITTILAEVKAMVKEVIL